MDLQLRNRNRTYISALVTCIFITLVLLLAVLQGIKLILEKYNLIYQI